MRNKYITIVSDPQNLEENVELDIIIELTFSDVMKKETVENSKNIMLTKDNFEVGAYYKYSVSPFGQTLFIKPEEDLEPETTYELKISSGEKGPLGGLEGNKTIQHNIEYQFTTKSINDNTPPKEDESEALKDEVTWERVINHVINTEKNEEDSEIIYDPLEDEVNNFYLEESFPSVGDLVDLDSHMVFKFNKPVKKKVLKEQIFIKESKMNSLLEKLNKESLIKGTIEAENGTEEDTEFIFKPNEVLKPGTEYQLVIKESIHEELKNDIRINFQTLFERMFADVGTVRLALGAFAERLTDLDLAKLINQQSNSIYQLASMMDSFNESDWAQENGVIVTFPYAASQYVVYSTAYYAILGRSLEGSSGMSESIKLADLSVAASNESSDNLSDLLELLKTEFERWWDVLQGKVDEVEPGTPNPNYKMTIATRGGDEAPYPDFQTRVPFNELGGRDS